MTEQQINTLWFRGYTHDGFQVSMVLDASATSDTVNALLAKLDYVRSAGISPTLPDGNTLTEEIHTVMRRVKSSDGTPIIDFYPKWQGEFGRFRFGYIYMDTDADIAAFEAQSGLKLDSIPLYDAQSPLTRSPGRVHPKEITVKTPFKLSKEKIGEGDDGKPRYNHYYPQAVTITTPSNITPMPPAAPSPVKQAVETDVIEVGKRDNGSQYFYVMHGDVKVAITGEDALQAFVNAGFDELSTVSEDATKALLFGVARIRYEVINKKPDGSALAKVTGVEKIQQQAS